jgi:LacI family transcriptional regulator
MNVTIKKIKEKTGFSITTISQALNNPPGNRVKEKTRKLILQAAKELNYTPNLAARALKTQKMGMISVIIPDITNFIYPNIIRAIDRKMLQNGYCVAFYDCNRELKNELLYIENSISKKMDGIIMAPTVSFAKYAEKLKNYPFVSLTSFKEDNKNGFSFNCALPNPVNGFYKTTSHLIKTGHRKIAALLRTYDDLFEHRRIDGLKKAFSENGLEFDKSLVLKIDGFDDKAAYDAVKEFLLKKPSFTAMVVYNDLMAMGAMNAILDSGLRIPEDVAVTGGDNIKISEYLKVPLTTYDINGYKVGEAAADLLLDIIKNDGKTIKPRKVLIEPDLIIRESSQKK